VAPVEGEELEEGAEPTEEGAAAEDGAEEKSGD
jgi:hypothetical protein